MKKMALALALSAGLLLAGCGSSGSQEAASNEAAQTASDYVFESNGTAVPIGVEAQPVLDELGEPLSYYEAESCAFGDLDKVWTYNGFVIYTYQTDEIDYIYDIVLSSDAIATPEGVSIGDSADKVKEAYGEPDEEDDAQLVYRGGEMKLIFLLTEDKVTSIDYQSTILE